MLNKINMICKKITVEPRYLAENIKKMRKNVDLRKTIYLKTAIIENEWTASLNIDIFEGPKYLNPLTELISLKLLMCFLTDPEILLHKDSLSTSMETSFFVKQL